MCRICSWLDLLGAAQDEVVILRPFEAGAKAGSLDQLRFENAEVRKEILGEEKGQFQSGLKCALPRRPVVSSLSSSL